MFFSKNRLLLISVAVVLAIDGGAADGSGTKEATKDASTMTPKEFVDHTVKNNKIVIFSKDDCSYCDTAKKCFKELNETFEVVELNGRADMSEIQDVLKEMTGARTVPRVFVNGKCIGGGDQVQQLFDEKKLKALVDEEAEN